MNFNEIITAALRRPRPPSKNMRGSVMLQPPEPEPYIGLPSQTEPGLEQVSPEDFVPNPKSIAAALAKGGAGIAAMTSKEALQEARRYANSLGVFERHALRGFVDPDTPFHSSLLHERIRQGIPLNPNQQQRVDLITKVLREAPRSDTPFKVYRGMPKAMVNDRPDPAFMSVSTSPYWGRKYARDVSDENWNYEDALGNPLGVSLSLVAPKGTPLVDPDIDKMFKQSELLFPRNMSISGKELILPEDFR